MKGRLRETRQQSSSGGGSEGVGGGGGGGSGSAEARTVANKGERERGAISRWSFMSRSRSDCIVLCHVGRWGKVGGGRASNAQINRRYTRGCLL